MKKKIKSTDPQETSTNLEEREDQRQEIARQIHDISAVEANRLGFMARQLVIATLPHRDPGPDVTSWERANGNFHLVLEPGFTGRKIDGQLERGFPFGTIPRLLMAWVSAEVTRTKKRELMLGNTLSEFMHALDMRPTGGKNGSITRLREQMSRLFTARISFAYADNQEFRHRPFDIAADYHFWWTPPDPNQEDLFPSTIILGEQFYNNILDCPVPIDMRALRYLRNSPLALDLYIWLTWRMSYLREPTKPIFWGELSNQFGCQYARERKFKEKLLEAMQSVHDVYPSAHVEVLERGLRLHPSPTHVPMIRRK